MRTSWISQRLLNQTLFVGVNLGIALAIWTLVLVPIFNLFSDQSNDLKDARTTLLRYQHIAAQDTSTRNFLAHLQAKTSDTTFLKGSSQGAINADLVARLKN